MAEGTSFCEQTDNGPGLPHGAPGDLGVRFGHGADAGTGSFGIGLSLARWVAEAQGGALALTSPVTDGRGFSARLTLPITPLPHHHQAGHCRADLHGTVA